MNLLIFARAVAWFGAAVTWWSLNVVWGDSIDAGKGPPGQWHRQVVGAGLLALIAAIALSASGRRGKPPSPLARGIAIASALGIGLIAYRLRNEALNGFPHLLAGTGWSWLLAGGGFLLAAGTLTIAAAVPRVGEVSAAGTPNVRDATPGKRSRSGAATKPGPRPKRSKKSSRGSRSEKRR